MLIVIREDQEDGICGETTGCGCCSQEIYERKFIAEHALDNVTLMNEICQHFDINPCLTLNDIKEKLKEIIREES